MYKHRVVALWVCLLTPACKKVINLDLRTSAPQIVIEGNLTDAAGPYYVKISKTVGFYADNRFPPVTDAVVSITDSTLGLTDQLQEVDSGVYATHSLFGLQHHTYILRVTVGGQQYAATSTMPGYVPLDSVTLVENVGINNKKQINAQVNFQDPTGRANYYEFTEAVNGRELPDIFVFEDRLSEGRYIQAPLFNDSAYLQRGDSLALSMNCVDANVYNYFFTLMNASGNNNVQGVTPDNPITNISNGALGYFSANTTQVARLRIP